MFFRCRKKFPQKRDNRPSTNAVEKGSSTMREKERERVGEEGSAKYIRVRQRCVSTMHNISRHITPKLTAPI